MKDYNRYLIIFITVLIIFSITGYFAQKNHSYLTKNIISLTDVVTLFEGNGIKLEPEKEFSTFALQNVRANNYLIKDTDTKHVSIWIFKSEEERKKAKAEWYDKTAIMDIMLDYEIYEAKNVMLILFAGDKSDELYKKVSAIFSVTDKAPAQNKIKPVPSAISKSDLSGIAYNGSDRYVAVGSMGKILTSSDGIKWTDSQAGIDKTLRGVVWGGKQFVAAGDEGTILTSKDGINWIYADSGVNTGLLRVMWDGRQYVAYGNGTVLTSTDGAVWAGKDVPDITLNSGTGVEISYHIADIFWDGKQYIAAGSGNFIMTSAANLDKWTVRVPDSLGTGMFCDLAWNGKRYVAVGDHLAMMTSGDGHKWTNEGLKINRIESVDDYYTLCLWSVVWGQDKFIAAGHRGLILTSVDGLDWSIIQPVIRAGLNQVIWDGKQYIAVGDNQTVIASADGVAWTVRN